MTDQVTEGGLRELSRELRQEKLALWAELAFGRDQATSIPQRGLRLLEEAIEAFQACGGDEAMAHKLVTYVFARPPGEVGQELGGVAVTVLLLAAAAGLSADEEECREVHRVLTKPVGEFTARNASKNAAGFLVEQPKGNIGEASAIRSETDRMRQVYAAALDWRRRVTLVPVEPRTKTMLDVIDAAIAEEGP